MKINYSDYKDSLKKSFKEIFKVTDNFCDMIFEKKLADSDIFSFVSDNEPISFAYCMPFDVKVKNEIKKCIYIYGVGVEEKHRCRGLSKKLLDEIYSYYSDKNISFLYLVPANEGLFSMYEKNGFKTEFYLYKREFDLKDTYPFLFDVRDGCFSVDLEGYSKKYDTVILRSDIDIEAILSYSSYKKINDSGFLFETDSDTVLIRESFIYDEDDLYSFLNYLKHCGFRKAVVTNSGNKKIPYAMVKKYESIDFGSGYTNMNFD